ncbi:MAG: hypothetical protein IJX63_06600 [Lachnospiraceae bacterium]|nr:hypothetical protein [Lachnospiraceae bacterium]
MNENGRKRREWVKSAAIVFLSVLLVLTFFSNTIMNYSLPEVAAQYIQSGNITAKIRGNGIIESGDPYNVKIAGTRKVESVEVRVGDEVEKGTILCVLSAEDSAELEAAKAALEAAQKDFELSLLTGSVDTSVMNNAGQTDSMENYKARIIRLQNEIAAAEAEVKAAEAEVTTAEDKVAEWQKTEDAFNLQISLSSATSIDTSKEEKAVKDAKTAMDNASFTLTEARNWLTAVESQISHQMTVSSGDSATLGNLEEQKIKANQSVISAETAYNSATLAYQKAQNALEAKQATDNKDTVVANLERQLAQIRIDMKKAQNELTAKQENLAAKQEAVTAKETALAELVKNINDEINLGSKYDAVLKAKEEVEKLEAQVSGSEVVAPITGTIMSVNVKSGLETPADGIVFTMQPEGEGYTMSFSVTNDQAKRLSVGDIAEPVNSWRYDNMEIVLDSIRPDPSNPSQNKLLLFNVSGENVVANQSLNVSVGQKSATYDMIVPNSAIREDNNGKFILIVESKSSPLGNRYIATRVDVEVIASDDTQSAITGAVYGWEFVITTSTKPVEAGQQVRLAEN